MAIQLVNVGTTANDGTGDPARTAFIKINGNWGTVSGQIAAISVGGSNTQVQFNDSGVFGGATITYNKTTHAVALGAATSGNVALTVNGVNGTHSTKIADAASSPTLYNAGFLEMPLKSLPVTLNPTYTALQSDSGKVLFYSQSAISNITVYIPDPGTTTFPIGTAISFINDSAYNITLSAPVGNPTGTVMLPLGIGINESPVIYPSGGATVLLVSVSAGVGRWYVNGVGYV